MRRRLWSCLMMLALVCNAAWGQEKEYKYEIGAGAGMSWGYGDVNATKAVYSPSASFSLVYRYNLNLRWALAAEVQSSGLSGDTRDFDYAFPSGDHSFSLRYWQLAVRPEIHFWNYGWGSDYREKKRYTPFMTLGLSAGVVSGNGTGSAFALGIPIGLGYKVKVAKRWNAQLTCLFTKTFSDRLDGLADPEGLQPSAMIGNDWMAALHLSVPFDFKERCVECHNQKYFGK